MQNHRHHHTAITATAAAAANAAAACMPSRRKRVTCATAPPRCTRTGLMDALGLGSSSVGTRLRSRPLWAMASVVRLIGCLCVVRYAYAVRLMHLRRL
jgi:hypothetical protein